MTTSTSPQPAAASGHTSGPSAAGPPPQHRPHRSRLTRGAGAVAVVVTLVVGGTLAAATLGGGTTRPGPAPAVKLPVAGAPVGSTDALAQGIAKLQAQLAAVPDDPRGLAQLGAAYVQEARLTSDPSYYPKADQALHRSLVLQPLRNIDAAIGLGSLDAGRHAFSDALREARLALSVNPQSAPAYGVEVDALTELGQYDAARDAAQRMLDLRPDVSSLTRASYQLELHGQLPEARQALERALQDASSTADTAFADYYLGELAWNAGDLAAAAAAYQAGLDADPISVQLTQGRAKVEWARGDTASALRDYATVVGRLPTPQFLTEYADLLRSVGRAREAADQDAVLQATVAILKANGVDVDLETSLYEADHGRPAAALTAAAAEWGRRHAIVVADAYAWALHRSGQDAAALPLARQAAATGYRSALFAFHRGMIELALGQRAAARRDLMLALATNPHFSPVQAPQARAALTTLG